MATRKNKVYYYVDDGGTLRKMGAEADKAAAGMGRVGKAARTADRNLKGTAAMSSNTTKNFSKMQQGAGGLVAAYATVASTVFALSAAFQFLKNAGDLRVLQDSQVAYSSATGIGMITLTKNIQGAARGLLTFRDAAQAAAIGTASGLGQDQIQNLAKGAANVSQILGRDVTDSFNRLIRGVTKAEPELLDELGITLRLDDANREYAASLGIAATKLTTAQKKQAVYLKVQKALAEQYDSVVQGQEAQGNGFQKLMVSLDKVLMSIYEFMAKFGEPIAEFLSKNIELLVIGLAAIAIPIVKQIIPGLNNWAAASTKAADESAAAYAKAKKELESLNKAQGGDPREIARAGLSAGTGSSGLKAMEQGKKLTQRQAAGLLRFAEAGQGAVTKMSKYQAEVYKKSLRDMLGQKEKWTQFVKRKTIEYSTSFNTATKKMEVRYKQAMAAMSRATSKLGQTVGRVTGALGMLSIIASGVKAALGFFFDDFDVVKEKVDNATDAIEDFNKEFARIEIGLARGGTAGAKAAVEYLNSFANILEQVADARAAYQTASGASKGAGLVAGFDGLLDKVSVMATALKGTTNPALLEMQERLKTVGEVLANRGSTIYLDNISAELNNIIADLDKFRAKLNNIKETGAKVFQDYSKTIESTTQFQSSVALQLNDINSVLKDIEDTQLSEELKDQVAALELIKKDLLTIEKIEKNRALRASEFQVEYTKFQRFGTTLLKEEIARRQKIVELEATLIEDKLQLKRINEGTIKSDEVSTQILRNKIEANEEILSQMEKQYTIAQELTKALAQGFESSFQQGLTDLITGDEGSLKDALMKMTESTIRAGVEAYSREITRNLMEKLFKLPEFETEEERAARIQKEINDAHISGMQTAFDAHIQKLNEVLNTSGLSGESKIDKAEIIKPTGTIDDPIYVIPLKPLNGSGVVDPPTPGELEEQLVPDPFIRKMNQEEPLAVRVTNGVGTNTLENFDALTGGKKDEGARQASETATDALGALKDGINSEGELAVEDKKAAGALGGLGSGLMGMLQSFTSAGGLGQGMGGLLMTLGKSIFGFKAGGIMTDTGKKIPGYASGGIAKGPRSGHPAILHGNEAVVPLPNGRSIPVEGGNTNTNNVSINVNMEQGSAKTSGDQQGQGGELGKALSRAVQEELQKQKRPGGILSPYGAA